MSSEDSTPADESEGAAGSQTTKTEKPGIVLRVFRCLLVIGLIAPVVAIHGFLHARDDEADLASEIDDRIAYVTGTQPVGKSTFIEVDIGHFNTSVVRSEIGKVVRIRFQLTGLMAKQHLGLFEDFRTEKLNRYRDVVITELTHTQIKNLLDPRLSELRARLMSRTNDMIGSIVFRNLIISNFTMVQQ